MPRDCKVYLEDMLSAIHKTASYTGGLSKAAFLHDDKTFDAIVRNLEVIGEAAKSISESIRRGNVFVIENRLTGRLTPSYSQL